MLSETVDSIAAETGFAGVVSVDRGGEVEFARAYGLAHRAHQVPNTIGTRFAIASGTKGLTALTVVSLIEHGALRLSTTARSVMGFWLHASADTVMLEGYDAGVSFRTVHDPRSGITHTVISNSSDGAWPITRRLDEQLAP